MASNRPERTHEEGPPQAFGMPFATLMLVLITFFIYLDSKSAPNAIRGARVANEVRKQFSKPGVPDKTSATRPDTIVSVAQAAGFQVKQLEDEYQLVLPGVALFESGDDQVRSELIPTLNRLADIVARYSLSAKIEGHTDDRPLVTPRFRSNWELSAARATAVLRIFRARGVPASRISAAGRAQYVPVASNESEEGRAQNRRIALTIFSHSSEVRER